MFRFDKFLEPVQVVVVSHARKNYFILALSDWAMGTDFWPTLYYWLCIWWYNHKISPDDKQWVSALGVKQFSEVGSHVKMQA